MVWMVLAVGCAHEPPVIPRTLPIPQEQTSPTQSREAHTLREELASARIAMAKQAATLESLKKAVTHLRQRETELVQQVKHLEDQLAKSRQEAATAHQQKTELEARAQAIPQLMNQLAEFRATQSEMQQTLATLTDVADELTWNQVQTNKGAMDQGFQSGSASVRIRVQPGDTLWEIARSYGLSVPELKRANGLTTNTIHVGQALLVPAKPENQDRFRAEVQTSDPEGVAGKAPSITQHP